MKKMFLGIIITMILGFAVTIAALHDYSSTGWTSSSGTNFLMGEAHNLTMIPGGYQFTCKGGGTCFRILGGDLWIYPPNIIPMSDEEGTPVTILQND